MVPRSITASAPASAMLFGEHAVLKGGTAIVAAIDCRTHVTLTPRTDTLINVDSNIGTTTTDLKSLSFGCKFRFVEGVFLSLREALSHGFDISIASSINPTVGLASSASVTVALLCALRAFLQLPSDAHQLLLDSLSVIRSVQGYGSGADAASIIYGGIISYKTEPVVDRLRADLPLVLVYSGKKTPTPEVIAFVMEQEARFPETMRSLFDAIDAISTEAVLKIDDFQALGTLMNQANGLMEALGVGTPELSSICWALRKDPGIFGAKISGSGLGDCAVGLGKREENCLTCRSLQKNSGSGSFTGSGCSYAFAPHKDVSGDRLGFLPVTVNEPEPEFLCKGDSLTKMGIPSTVSPTGVLLHG